MRLVFLGMRHPNPLIPEMRMAVAARRLADELGLTGTHVIFNEEWVAYDERQNFLLDADIGVSTHLHHVETDYSFRTRILDYLWASLPIVSTTGDAHGRPDRAPRPGPDRARPTTWRRWRRRCCACSTTPTSPSACRDQHRRGGARPALVQGARAGGGLLPRPAARRRTWPPGGSTCWGGHRTEVEPAPHGVRHDVGLAVQYVRQGGATLLARKVRDRVTRVTARWR